MKQRMARLLARTATRRGYAVVETRHPAPPSEAVPAVAFSSEGQLLACVAHAAAQLALDASPGGADEAFTAVAELESEVLALRVGRQDGFFVAW